MTKWTFYVTKRFFCDVTKCDRLEIAPMIPDHWTRKCALPGLRSGFALQPDCGIPLCGALSGPYLPQLDFRQMSLCDWAYVIGEWVSEWVSQSINTLVIITWTRHTILMKLCHKLHIWCPTKVYWPHQNLHSLRGCTGDFWPPPPKKNRYLLSSPKLHTLFR